MLCEDKLFDLQQFLQHQILIQMMQFERMLSTQRSCIEQFADGFYIETPLKRRKRKNWDFFVKLGLFRKIRKFFSEKLKF